MADRAASILGKRVLGALGGDIPTAEIPKARRAYMDYVESFTGEDSERLEFTDFVRQKWKKTEKVDEKQERTG